MLKVRSFLANVQIKSSRWYFDTPFWNGYGIPDTSVCLCSEQKCYKRSEINYFAQGMWGAVAGETLEETLEVVRQYKMATYHEEASEGVDDVWISSIQVTFFYTSAQV